MCPAQDSNQRGDPAAGFLDKGHLTSGFREGLLSSRQEAGPAPPMNCPVFCLGGSGQATEGVTMGHRGATPEGHGERTCSQDMQPTAVSPPEDARPMCGGGHRPRAPPHQVRSWPTGHGSPHHGSFTVPLAEHCGAFAPPGLPAPCAGSHACPRLFLWILRSLASHSVTQTCLFMSFQINAQHTRRPRQRQDDRQPEASGEARAV